jgi:hypothetical protein
MMRKTVIVAAVLIVSPIPTSAAIINVPADYPTIQQGIDASVNRDTVLVQPGTYYENINFNGHNIVLGSLYLTTGDTSYIAQTIIDGSGVPMDEGLINFISGEDSTARVTGFTMTIPYGGGSTTVYCDSSSPTISHNIIRDAYLIARGAGISCRNYASPIIVNNMIIDNTNYNIDSEGGGICCVNHSSPLIKDNLIRGNYAVYGGGIYCLGCPDVRIINNEIYDNGASFAGGGIFCMTSNATINGNEILGNYGSFWGGGIFCGGPVDIVISNNIIAGNYGWNAKGGGIYSRATDPLIINNTIFGNIADSTGGGLYCFDSNPILINNILWGDSIGWPDPIEANEIYADSGGPVVEYCDIQGGWPGTGNIDIDPLFRDPPGGDLHLMATICGDSLDSPCIDAGDPNILDSLLDCSWGLGAPRSDMGAYGGGDSLITAIYDNMPSLPDRFVLLQNYPNPFNAQTTIRFVLPESQIVQLTIYDLLGRRVETIIDEYLQVGVHAVTFDASHLSSGVYFYRLQAGERIETKRMVLLK